MLTTHLTEIIDWLYFIVVLQVCMKSKCVYWIDVATFIHINSKSPVL